MLPLTLLLPFLIGAIENRVSFAADQNLPRQTTIIVSYTEYEWWLISWLDNAILCRLFLDHEGLPTNEDIRVQCGSGLLAAWNDTPPCQQISDGTYNTNPCSGLYLYFVSSQPTQREVVIDLPEIQAYVTLEGCSPSPPDNRCAALPSLLITAEEPLPNERIMRIHGTYNHLPFACEETPCALPLQATPLEGMVVEFQADSSFGDSSRQFSAQVRVIDSGVSGAPAGGGWHVDVLSNQWRGAPLASCSQTWNAFPPVGGLPDWLDTPEHLELIATYEPYYYLAGRLIGQGLVDASSCPTGGLEPTGYADPCGLEVARPMVEAWQNRFDEQITAVAREVSIPATLMKDLFAQESQFWPGMYRIPYEFGLGQITDNGADALLLWNTDFYNQFCPLVLSLEACNLGYLHLTPYDQSILRGALASQAKSDCPTCSTGIDLTNVDFSLKLFANTIRANCDQVAQIVFNATQETPGSVASYEDLWRLTVANYHAGPGCVSYAVHMAWLTEGTLAWDQVAAKLTEPCQGVIPYVDKIAGASP